MFRYTVIFFTITLAALVAQANPTPRSYSQCNTGNVQCCNQVQRAGAPGMSTIIQQLLDLDIPVQNADTNIGTDCTPINALGMGNGANCASEPVCCDNNTEDGLIGVGCSPVNAEL
ncbi:fungal hydrophobin-domain-containing protein [Abortiporus biennis]|nr:fungal hydrophobin-domain-containing protein [Abortiporus biennis]